MMHKLTTLSAIQAPRGPLSMMFTRSPSQKHMANGGTPHHQLPNSLAALTSQEFVDSQSVPRHKIMFPLFPFLLFLLYPQYIQYIYIIIYICNYNYYYHILQ
jgi:hypothetical protein